jgi:hypothetical protein
MRPLEYRDYLVDLLKRTPGVQRATTAEGGPYPFALSATVDGKDQRWQVIGQLAEGAKHGVPTPAMEGRPAAFKAAPSSSAPDAWLAGVIGAAESAEVERIEVWSARMSMSSVGLTIFFHNGERAFVRLA